MKTIKTILTVLVAAGFMACNQNTASQKPKEEQKSRVMILCDASGSVTTTSSGSDLSGRLNKLKYYVKKIPKWYPIGSEFFFYPVSDNLLSDKLGEVVSYNIKRRSQLNPEKHKVDSLTNNICTEINVLSANTHNSCILLSVKRAINKLNELPLDSMFRNELIIISDMIESCEIKMSTVNTAQLNMAITQFEAANPNINATNLNLKVTVIINSPGMGEQFELIRDVWHYWFSKIGVVDIVFYTEEPNIPENKLLNK